MCLVIISGLVSGEKLQTEHDDDSCFCHLLKKFETYRHTHLHANLFGVCVLKSLIQCHHSKAESDCSNICKIPSSFLFAMGTRD